MTPHKQDNEKVTKNSKLSPEAQERKRERDRQRRVKISEQLAQGETAIQELQQLRGHYETMCVENRVLQNVISARDEMITQLTQQISALQFQLDALNICFLEKDQQIMDLKVLIDVLQYNTQQLQKLATKLGEEIQNGKSKSLEEAANKL